MTSCKQPSYWNGEQNLNGSRYSLRYSYSISISAIFVLTFGWIGPAVFVRFNDRQNIVVIEEINRLLRWILHEFSFHNCLFGNVCDEVNEVRTVRVVKDGTYWREGDDDITVCKSYNVLFLSYNVICPDNDQVVLLLRQRSSQQLFPESKFHCISYFVE